MERHVDSIETRSSINLNTTTILKADGTSFINEKAQRDLLPLVSESPASHQSPALASTLPSFPGHAPFTPAMPFPHSPPQSAASPITVSLCWPVPPPLTLSLPSFRSFSLLA